LLGKRRRACTCSCVHYRLACRTQCAAFACLTRSNPAPPVTSRLNGTQGRSGGPDRAGWTSSLRCCSRGTSRSLECTLPVRGPAGARSQTCSWPRPRWVTKRAAYRIPFTCMVHAHAHFSTSSQNYVGGARLSLAVAGAGGAAGVGLAQRAVGGERRRALVRIARDLRARDRVGASVGRGCCLPALRAWLLLCTTALPVKTALPGRRQRCRARAASMRRRTQPLLHRCLSLVPCALHSA